MDAAWPGAGPRPAPRGDPAGPPGTGSAEDEGDAQENAGFSLPGDQGTEHGLVDSLLLRLGAERESHCK